MYNEAEIRQIFLLLTGQAVKKITPVVWGAHRPFTSTTGVWYIGQYTIYNHEWFELTVTDVDATNFRVYRPYDDRNDGFSPNTITIFQQFQTADNEGECLLGFSGYEINV